MGLIFRGGANSIQWKYSFRHGTIFLSRFRLNSCAIAIPPAPDGVLQNLKNQTVVFARFRPNSDLSDIAGFAILKHVTSAEVTVGIVVRGSIMGRYNRLLS